MIKDKDPGAFLRIIDDDAPLPGPWSRPAPRENRGNEAAANDDAPLSGPWRRTEPREVQKEKEVAIEEHSPLSGTWDRPIPQEVKKEKEPIIKEDIPLHPQEVRAECPAPQFVRKKRNRENLQVLDLFNRQSLLSGIIMSEILGPPGGHRRNRLMGRIGRR